MQNTLPRCAVIGSGYWGKNLVRNIHELGALAAICDSNQEGLAAIGANYPDARQVSDLNEVLADSEIDAVLIATPAVTHGEIARKALEAGKHVFVEKPLCLDLKEARELSDFADSKGLTLMIGHLLLYHPAFIALRDFVRAGGIGNLRYIYSNRASLGKIRIEESALWSFAPHDISMILNLVGRLPERVQSSGNGYITEQIADVCLTSMSFSEGVAAHIFVSWLHPYKDHKLVIVGTDGMIVFNDVEKGADKLLVWRHQISQGERSIPPTVDRAQAEPLPYDEGLEPLRNECMTFLTAAADGIRPTSDGQEAERVLTVLAAAQTSMERQGDAISCTDAELSTLYASARN